MTTPEPETAPTVETGERIGAVLAVALALVGLLGALVAWRAVELGSDASDASRSALSAARERSGAILAAESNVAGAHAAWVAYELDRRRAEELRLADEPGAALRADKAASAHWGFVDSGYIDADGIYRPDDHRDGFVARQAERLDLDPAAHLAVATAAEARGLDLSLVGVLVAAALPLLTLAEVTRGRVRLLAALGGAVILASGAVAVVLLWG